MESETSQQEKDSKYWTQEKCLELIALYKERPILWDPKHPHYFNKTRKKAAWKKIGEQLKMPSFKVREKMHIILSSFRREKAKLTNSIKKGYHFTSGWFGFKELSFLLIKHRDTYKKGCQKKQEVKKQADPTQWKPIVVEPKPSTSTSESAAETGDEITAFTNFIGSKMRKYSQATNSAVQQAICNIIFKADQNVYEPVKCDSTSSVTNVPTNSVVPKLEISSETNDSNEGNSIIVKNEQDFIEIDDDS